MRSIRKQLTSEHVLSVADARLAMRSGLIDMPAVERSGFNDGIIYEPVVNDGLEQAPAAPTLDRPTKRFALAAPTGTLHCLVLLVDFDDNVGKRSPAEFEQLLFDPTNADSMHSFYKDASYGALTITGTVTPWMRATRPYSHYTAGASGTGNDYPRNTPGLLDEMLQQYCDTGDLSSFDLNEDGYVDGLFLIHAGGGAEADETPAGRRDKIWSHKWTLPGKFENAGIAAYAYFTAPEDGRLGVFAHEFGHFLGLPDLYDTTYRSYGVGSWCLMAGGSWNGSGHQPARLSAWCLKTLGWIAPQRPTKPITIDLLPLDQDSQACYCLWSGGKHAKEYFLIENRQQSGRDAKLPGHGLLVWHIDETQSDNSNPLCYRVALVQADGKRALETSQSRGDDGDPFPGSAGVTRVDSTTFAHPNLRDNAGYDSKVILSDITETNHTIGVKIDL